MTKPDNPSNWATSDSALKQTVSASRQADGWTATIDSDLNLIAEKPPIKEWNGWMNAVGQWVDIIGEGLTDDSGDVDTFIDFAKWELGSIVDGPEDFPYLGEIGHGVGLDSEGLVFIAQGAAAVDTTEWDDYKRDAYAGARALELRDMLMTGQAIKLVDYADITWIIYADFIREQDITMGGTVNLGTAPYIVVTDPIFIGTPPGGFPGIRIIKIDAGVVTNPTTFADFTDFGGFGSSEERFNEKNPKGIRIGILGTAKPTQLAAQVSSVKTGFPIPIRRRWIRPLVVTKQEAIANPASFPMDFRVGGRYRWSLHFISRSPAVNQIVGVYASRSGTTDKVGEFSTESTNLGYSLSGEFQYLGTAGDAGLTFTFNSGFTSGPDWTDTTISNIYQITSIVNNYITVEELY